MIWLRALSFVVAVQLTVVGAIPWLLARVGPRVPMGLWHWLAIVPLTIGAAALLWCNWAFVMRGRGTAAPYDPPRELVVQGLYRHVRNPMYVSAILILVGIGLWTGAVSLFVYTLLLALSYHLFVRFYEEPHLQRVFGQSYVEYCAGVPRWWPRLTPVAATSKQFELEVSTPKALANFGPVIITPKAFSNSSPLTPKALANFSPGLEHRDNPGKPQTKNLLNPEGVIPAHA